MNTHSDSRNLLARILVLAAVCLAALVMPLSFTGPAIALTAIHQTLGGSAVELGWVTNAFMLSFGSSLMAAGTLADTYGRKRLFLVGMALFALAALALAGATSMPAFIALRAVQGLAASLAFASGMAALAQTFTGPTQTRAFSLIGTTFGVGLAFGPLLSGYLIAHHGWRALFLCTAIIASLALLVGSRFMRESRDPDAVGLDWPGAISFTGALTLFTYAVLQVPMLGWGDRLVVGLLVIAALTFAVFVWVELHVTRPMLDLQLFRFPRFVGVQFLAAAPAYAYVVLLILLPIRMVGVEGHTALEAGRMMIALSAPLLIVPMLAAFATRWFSAGTLSGCGLLVSALGLFWLGHYPVVGDLAHTLLPMLLIGLGISLPWGLMDGLAVSVVPPERAGMAAGIFSTTRVAGEGVALGLVGALLAVLTQGKLVALLNAQGIAVPAPAALASAASQIAMGNPAQAMRALPTVPAALLTQAYAGAFQSLLYLLSGITVLTGLIVFRVLNQPAHPLSGSLKPREARA
ncbi:MAG: MFS transporter [Burkholderiales bacterium]|nr:MFS transporter [Burkholderiales bacterium]